MLTGLILKLGTLSALIFGWFFISSKYEKQPLSGRVHNFGISCESMLTALAKSEPLTEEGRELIEHYCKQILQKLQSQKQKV